jgi:hypothetical protein
VGETQNQPFQLFFNPCLMAATRGGSSEPAAVRGDAGPDRTVTGTDGIERG